MNPYDVTLANVTARSFAWLRGVTHLYRKPLFVLVAASVTLAVGVGAAKAPPPVTIAQLQR